MKIRSYKNPSHRDFYNKCCDTRLFGCSPGCDAYLKLCVTLSASNLAHSCNLGIIKTGVIGRRDDHTFDENRYKKSFAFSSFLVSALPDINAENFTFTNLSIKMFLKIASVFECANARVKLRSYRNLNTFSFGNNYSEQRQEPVKPEQS